MWSQFSKKTTSCLCIAFTLLCLLAAPTFAQDNETSQYDRGTPPQHAAGVSPIGSYSSADLGTVNLGNGSLNFKIPLGSVGGRGFSVPLTLNYSNKVWSAHSASEFITDPTPHQAKVVYAVYDDPDAPADFYQRVAPGWTMGAAPALQVRGMGLSSVHNPNGCDEYMRVLVKLTLILPDRGEVELRDDYTDGSPLGGRGREWFKLPLD